jgi:hypothetical protein
MKYLILIYSRPETWGHPSFLRTTEGQTLSESERTRLTGQLEELISELHESGEIVAGAALADPLNSRTVRVREDAAIVTDGPYVEAKEQMAGLFIVDCATPERAEQIAGRFPEARFSAVEVRPVMESSGEEM